MGFAPFSFVSLRWMMFIGTLVPSIPHVGDGSLSDTVQAAFGDLDSVLLLVTDLRLPGVRNAGRIVAAPVDESLSRLLSMLGVV